MPIRKPLVIDNNGNFSEADPINDIVQVSGIQSQGPVTVNGNELTDDAAVQEDIMAMHMLGLHSILE